MRLDLALVERGLARSRSHASALVGEGRVSINGVTASKPSVGVGPEDVVEAETDQWVSRAAHKLLGALEASRVEVRGRVLDAGASTGGFTQVCLERGADVVYAVDVGHDQLAPILRRDPRVRVHEGLNLRYLSLDDVDGDPVDLIVGDVSFISLRLLLPTLLPVLHPEGAALLLVKPQFEVGREALGHGGVVRDDRQRRRAVDDVARTAGELGWVERWRGASDLPGAAGNVEYFVHLTR
ncbi:TlyA family RNA methyltransferase [Tessaracoccus sp. Z1128]